MPLAFFGEFNFLVFLFNRSFGSLENRSSKFGCRFVATWPFSKPDVNLRARLTLPIKEVLRWTSNVRTASLNRSIQPLNDASGGHL
jgi:hypothetical protein